MPRPPDVSHRNNIAKTVENHAMSHARARCRSIGAGKQPLILYKLEYSKVDAKNTGGIDNLCEHANNNIALSHNQ